MTAPGSYPTKTVLAAAAVIIALFAGMTWTAWSIYQTHATFNAREDRLLELRGTLDHFHEVLAMSTRMAAATGNPQWENRYRTFEPQLQAAIQEAVRLTPAAYLTLDAAGETLTKAHDALGSMERQAFALVRQSHLGAAAALLSGEQYQTQQRRYTQGLELIRAAFSTQTKTHHAAQLQRAALVSVYFVTFLAVMVGTWLYLLRVASKHQRELKESETRYRSLFENMLNGFAYCRMHYDDHGRPVDFVFLSVNDAFERLTGLKNVAGKPVSEVIPGLKTISPEVLEIYGRVASTGLPETFEFDFKTNNQWLNIAVYSPEKGSFIAVFEDITERKRMEDGLRASAEYARNLIEASLDPILAIGMDSKITDVNIASEALTGLPRERLIGSNFWTCFTEPDKAQEGYRQVLAQGTMRDYPLTVRHTSGRLVDVLYSAAVYCDKEGVAQGVLATIRDITERKRMEEQASRMERLAALGQLLGGIAHEIKNPLFIVTGHLQLLKERLANREYDTVGADIQSIEEASKRMAEITQRFLSLSRPSMPNLQRCSVHDILTQTLNFLANELMKNRIQVVRAFAPDIPPTWSEPRQLYEVFLNLILNAMQAMTAARGQGTLTITTGGNDGSIMVRIQDDGPGIPPKYRARLFEPFFSTKPPEQGTGLGLWAARSTLAGLDGSVTCEPVEGLGATFIVRIPIVSHPPKE